MSKQLYEEALADVKKLKEVAEDNAKKALIEAVTPRIKDLIENQILREMNLDEEEEGVDKDYDGDLLLDDGPVDDLAFHSPSSPPSFGSPMSPALMGSTTNVGMGPAASVGFGSSTSFDPSGEAEVVLDLGALSAEEPEESVSMLGTSVEEARRSTKRQIVQIENKVNSLSKLRSNLRKMSGFSKLVAEAKEEVETIYGGIQESKLDSRNKKLFETKLEAIYDNINKLMEQDMKRIREAKLGVEIEIPELGDEELNLDDATVTLAPEEGEEDLGGEEEGEDLDLGGEEEGDEGDEGEEGEEELDLDLGGEEEGDEGEEGEEEGEDDDMEEGMLPMESRRLSNNTIVEIDENMLRRELGRMKTLREAREANTVVEIDENMLRREIKRMRALREAADDVQSWGHGPGDVSDDFEDEDLGDPFLDGEVTTEGLEEYDMNELSQMYEEEEGDDPEKDLKEMDLSEEDYKQAVDSKQAMGPGAASASGGEDTGQERERNIKESVLRRRLAAEHRLQLEAKKRAKKAHNKMKETQQKGKQAAAKAGHAAKKGDAKGAQASKKEAAGCAKQSKQLKEAYIYYATKFNESVRRTRRLQTVLAEVRRRGAAENGASSRLAESSKLRSKLAETNLFNAKLLYSNKLLQNESLTKRQKAEIIQRLDEAKSEREVKLVYESLVKTLSGASRQLSEVAERRVLGSSSQATRPASTLMNEGVELNRWAKLAGIK